MKSAAAEEYMKAWLSSQPRCKGGKRLRLLGKQSYKQFVSEPLFRASEHVALVMRAAWKRGLRSVTSADVISMLQQAMGLNVRRRRGSGCNTSWHGWTWAFQSTTTDTYEMLRGKWPPQRV